MPKTYKRKRSYKSARKYKRKRYTSKALPGL